MQKKTKNVISKGIRETLERVRLGKINKEDEKAEGFRVSNILEILKENARFLELGTHL